MRVIETKAYQFEELNNEAKEKAIASNREWNIEGFDWWYSVYETYSRLLALLGADCELTRSRNMKGETIWKPAINFTGFWSQGDGASFDCNYQFKKGAVKAIKEEFGNDSKFVEFARRLNKIQRPIFYNGECQIRRNGRYCHENTMYVSEFNINGIWDAKANAEFESEVIEVFRDIAKSLYNALESEYEYLTSDESVSRSLICNECEFTEEGESI